jgi:phospholipid/cholesterol/gamma-HCH transport system substrate-binding protein
MNMKNNLSRNALIGLAFIASLFMIYFGINFLKGANVFKKQNQYYAIFGDVSKLLISSLVYVKGYQVGLINNIKMADSDPIQFLVGINLEEDFKIPEGSYLQYGIDMFGASTVNLVLVASDKYLQPGDTLSGDKEIGLMDGVAGVMPRADSILIKIDSIVYSLNKLISHPVVESSIIGLGSAVDQLNNTSMSLNRIVNTIEKDLPQISQNLNSATEDLKTVSDNLSQFDLNKTYASIDETINNLKLLTDKLNSNNNSLGLLLNDTSLHDSINVTIDNATRLLEDIRENPDRYLTIRLKLF